MTAPLRFSVEEGCRPETAFRLWTEGLGRWWPADHTVTGDPESVALEGRVGGRGYERAHDGNDDTTVVEIEHTGGERFGDGAGVWRERNHAGWVSLLPHLAAAATSLKIGAALDGRPERGRDLT